jgi:hypothetical protein
MNLRITLTTFACLAVALLATPFAAYPQAVESPAQSDAEGAKIAETPAFKSFIENLKACFDPVSQALMAKDEKGAADSLEMAFSDRIPAKHNIVVTSIAPNAALPLTNMGVVYPVRPTIQVDINFSTDTGDQNSTTLFLAMTGGKWFEIYTTGPTTGPNLP